jgi:hypothetical protein
MKGARIRDSILLVVELAGKVTEREHRKWTEDVYIQANIYSWKLLVSSL